MSNLFTFEKVGPKATGEIKIFKRPPVTQFQKNGQPIYIEKGNILIGFPNIAPYFRKGFDLHEIPINTESIHQLKGRERISGERGIFAPTLSLLNKPNTIEQVQQELFNIIFYNNFAFRSLETKKIDFDNENSLLIEALDSGSHYNFPANSHFRFKGNILGYNPKPLKNGKFSPISKINYFNIKVPRISNTRDIENLKLYIKGLHPTRSLNLDNKGILANPEKLSFYFITNSKKEFQLIKTTNLDVNNYTLIYLFEFLVRTEEYIEFIREFQLPEILDFVDKVRSYINTKLKLKGYGWPVYNYCRNYPITYDFMINFNSFYKTILPLSLYQLNHTVNSSSLLSVKSEFSIFFEGNKMFKNQVIIIAKSEKSLNLIIEFLDVWKAEFIPKAQSYELGLKKIQESNPDRLEELIELLDNLSIVTESDYRKLSMEYSTSNAMERNHYFKQLHNYFNFTTNS